MKEYERCRISRALIQLRLTIPSALTVFSFARVGLAISIAPIDALNDCSSISLELVGGIRDEMKDRVALKTIGPVGIRVFAVRCPWCSFRSSVHAAINWGANIWKSRLVNSLYR